MIPKLPSIAPVASLLAEADFRAYISVREDYLDRLQALTQQMFAVSEKQLQVAICSGTIDVLGLKGALVKSGA